MSFYYLWLLGNCSWRHLWVQLKRRLTSSFISTQLQQKTLNLILRRHLKHSTPKVKEIAYKTLVRPQKGVLQLCVGSLRKRRCGNLGESAAQGRTFRKRRTQKRIHCQTNDMRFRMAEPRSAQGCQLPIPDVQNYPRPCRCWKSDPGQELACY